jgi:hypothetical protein
MAETEKCSYNSTKNRGAIKEITKKRLKLSDLAEQMLEFMLKAL